MKELDYGQALVFLEKAVAEKGADFTYERRQPPTEDEDAIGEACLYFEQGQPSCIVGHVMSYMGIENPREGLPAGIAMAEAGVGMDVQTRTLLNKVQEYQDNGVPWGEAVRVAQGFNS